jgi:hypothetical protein
MPAKKTQLLVEHVHGATFALGTSILPAKQLSHHRVGCHAAHQRLPVIAIGGDDVVVLPERHDDAAGDGFLANIEVAKATNLANGIHLGTPLLEAALQHHRIQQIAIECGVADLAVSTIVGWSRFHRCFLRSGSGAFLLCALGVAHLSLERGRDIHVGFRGTCVSG